jgi:ribosomal protein S18 acetylase RimI-like enzyme
MKFEIISITENHIEQFRQAVGAVAREKRFLAFLDTPSYDMSREFVLNNIKDDWPHVIALVENKVVGWCDITSLHRLALAHAGVLGIGVVKQYRGMGVGKALMQRAIELARKKGLTRVELTVREDNEVAIALYEKMGFVIEGKHKNAICIDGRYENQIAMALLFDDNVSNSNGVVDLQELELSLITNYEQNNEATLSRLLSDDFIEYGKSGQIHTKKDVIEQIKKENEPRNIVVENLTSKKITDTVAQITYATVESSSQVLRSSIWKKEYDGWQIVFHQATKII